ncbi:hypothetical protein HK101_005552 [Irineochytrium annulatum]|nr:hypothetical protein HK101_005552 [Irineochytrium annulatum]
MSSPIKLVSNLAKGAAPVEDKSEPDTPLEEHVVLRITNPALLAAVRTKVKDNTVDEHVKIVFEDQRHAIFHFDNVSYPAKLFDLPCIIESQKTFDNKQMFKICDICQMLVVEPPDPPPKSKSRPTEDFQWPHGITPPLQNVRKRRFRQRISKRAIEDVEREVERLLQEDAEAEDVRYEVIHAVGDDALQDMSELGTPLQPDGDASDADDDNNNNQGTGAAAAVAAAAAAAAVGGRPPNPSLLRLVTRTQQHAPAIVPGGLMVQTPAGLHPPAGTALTIEDPAAALPRSAGDDDEAGDDDDEDDLAAQIENELETMDLDVMEDEDALDGRQREPQEQDEQQEGGDDADGAPPEEEDEEDGEGGDSEEDDEEEESEEEEEGGAEDVAEEADENDPLREEIADLEASIREKSEQLQGQINPIMRTRFEGIVKKLTAELEKKKIQLTERKA